MIEIVPMKLVLDGDGNDGTDHDVVQHISNRNLSSDVVHLPTAFEIQLIIINQQ